MSMLSFLAHEGKNTWAKTELARRVLTFPVLIFILGDVGILLSSGLSEYKCQVYSGASSNMQVKTL